MKLLVIILALFAIAFANTVTKLEGRIVGANTVTKLEERIVGGVVTTIESFPYQVSVRVADQHICGGSIINVQNILTAAHCVYGKDHSRYSIRAGNSKHRAGEQFKVKRVIINNDYDPLTIDNDLAILVLESPLSFNMQIQAIPLQSPCTELAIGLLATVTGWGIVKAGENENIPDNLRMTNVAIVSNLYCQKKYLFANSITSHMICAHSTGQDSCQGDSGGPLAADGRLIGVVSWGNGCGSAEYPGVYAKVSNLHSWIVANLYCDDNNSGTQFSISAITLLVTIISLGSL